MDLFKSILPGGPFFSINMMKGCINPSDKNHSEEMKDDILKIINFAVG